MNARLPRSTLHAEALPVMHWREVSSFSRREIIIRFIGRRKIEPSASMFMRSQSPT